MTLVTLQLPKKGACPKNWIVRLRDLKFPFKNLPKTSHHNLKLFFKKIQEFVALTGVIILPTHRFAWGNFREIPEKTTHRFATGWNSDQVEFGCSQKQGWAPKMNGENNGFHPICLMADLGGKTHHFRKYPKNQQVSTLPNHGLETPSEVGSFKVSTVPKKTSHPGCRISLHPPNQGRKHGFTSRGGLEQTRHDYCWVEGIDWRLQNFHIPKVMKVKS